MSTETPKRVLLVEDEPCVAACIRDVLVSRQTLEVCVAATSRKAQEEATSDCLAAALVDLGLPDGDGVDLIAELHERRPNRPILALTSATGADRIIASLRAGASGYLFKDDVDARLVDVVSELCAGGSPLSAGAASVVVRSLRPDPPPRSPRLTPREATVLALLAGGAGYAEIARETRTSINTVRSHVRATYEKLGVENRAEAIDLAWRWGLLREQHRR